MTEQVNTHLTIAIESTKKTIEKRAFYFRNLVISVILLFLSSIVCAVIFKAFYPLALILLIIPLCAFFIYWDNLIVCNWSKEIKMLVIQNRLDLDTFEQTVISIKSIPQGTILGMMSRISFYISF